MAKGLHGLAVRGLLAAHFVVALSGAAAAQQAPGQPSNQPLWQVQCGDPNNAQTCRMVQNLVVDRTVQGQKQRVGRLLNITILYVGEKPRRPVMVMSLPLGIDLRPGAVLRIDGFGERNVPFLRCTNAGCEVRAELTAKLVGELKRGNTLRVGFRPVGSNQTMVVDASLKGFTKAFDRLM